MGKRGVIVSNLFVYILTLGIVIAVLLLGYKSFNKSSNLISKGELVQLRNKIEFDIRSASAEYGTLKKSSYLLPNNLEEICFVDLEKKDEIISSRLISFYPLIKDSVKGNLQKNVFFIGKAQGSSIFVDGLKIDHYPFMVCFLSENQKIEVEIEGLGGKASKVGKDFKTQASSTDLHATFLKSADGLVTIAAQKESMPKGTTISIEMIPPTSRFPSGGSDTYKFEPINVKFDPPIELRIRYHPDAVGECPKQLPFNQVAEDGSRKTTSSESIDCNNKIAVFKIDEFI